DKMGFPVFPLEWVDPVSKNISKGYREGGYLPEALVNFLALLGWNPGVEQELFSVEELIALFDLEKVNKAGAHFDIEKIKWFNHQYLQKIPVATLVEDFSPILAEKGVNVSKEKLTDIVALIRERATFLTDFWDLAHFFFEAPTQYEAKALKKQWKENSAEIVKQLVGVVEGLTDLTPHHIETQIKDFITQNNLGLGQVMPLIRLSLVGEMKGPDVFSIIAILGREEAVRRLQHLVQYPKE
ncbi:MAG: glutamate--tRNA ligase, partial [Capnocytophaga sp.]|nr:glutamate--tRNA ligase [Capnocytophaga sp.]